MMKEYKKMLDYAWGLSDRVGVGAIITRLQLKIGTVATDRWLRTNGYHRYIHAFGEKFGKTFLKKDGSAKEVEFGWVL